MGHAKTSKKMASKAGKALRSKKSSKLTKSLAARVLGDAPHKKRRSRKRRRTR